MAQDLDYLAGNISLLLQKADTIHRVSPTEMYLGFCAQGTISKDEPNWAICKVIQDTEGYPNNTDVLWANGQRQKVLVFNNFANYDYQYKNF